MSSRGYDPIAERTPLLVDVTVPSVPSEPDPVDEEAGVASASTASSVDRYHAPVSVLQIVLVLLIGTYDGG